MDSTHFDTYALKTNISRYLSTGNPIFDLLLSGIISSVLLALSRQLTRENLNSCIRWLKSFFKSSNVVQVTSESPIHKVKISTKRCMTFDDYNSSYHSYDHDLDEFNRDNSELMIAFFWFLDRHLRSINEAELGLMVNSRLEYRDQIVRDFNLMIRPEPDKPIVINQMQITYHQSTQEQKAKSTGRPASRGSRYDSDDEGDPGSSSKTKKIESLEQHFVITSRLPTEEIVKFVKSVWQEYIDTKIPLVFRPEKKGTEKWYFDQIPGDKSHSVMFDRYRLSSRKTMDDIFFPKKDNLVKRIDEFLAGKTSFSRFTIMLYGPPGGGKSSFIKALHNKTGYSVINVKFGMFTKFEDLMNLFHNDKIQCRQIGSITLPLDKRIYVLEDIDAGNNKMVLKRKSQQELEEEEEKKNKEALEKEKKMLDGVEVDENFWTRRLMTMGKGHLKFCQGEQGITLSDLLNLFDGVLELQDCFIVMTTNHLDKLDPALIRPGRVTYRLELGQISKEDMKAMIHHRHPDQYDPLQPNSCLDPLLEKLPPLMPCKFEELIQHEDGFHEVIENLKNQIETQT